MRASQGQLVYLKNYREPDYRALTVDLDISLQATVTRVVSKTVYQRHKQAEAGLPLQLDGDELSLVGVKVNGKTLKEKQIEISPAGLKILAPPKARKFTVEIETEINPTANTKLMGLYRSGGNYCTQCEAEGFRRITYFTDRPDVLAIYTVRMEAERKEAPILLSNGNCVDKGRAGKGRHYAVWHDPHPKPSYLFALVAGELSAIRRGFKTASGRPVKLAIYVQKNKEKSAAYAMDALVRSMRWDEEFFGCEYDLDVFNIVAIPDFNMGAMENKGLNIFNDKYVLADPDTATDTDYANIEAIIAHEYFHNWTGNRITCRDWFQLCLKEGLTVYRDQEFSADQRSRPVKRIEDVRMLRARQFPEDAGPLAHPVRPETYREINNFYTATVYEKGAEIVRMLATVLGQKQFDKGIRLYLKRHDGDAATIEQFLKCFEDAAKVELDQFALWYSQAGTPALNLSSKYDKAAGEFLLEVEQHTPATPGQARKRPMVIPQRVELLGKDGAALKPAKVTGAPFEDGVLHLTKSRHRIKFSGIGQRPALSINRGFTAPVEVDYRQSVSDLAFLALNDSDPFNRWQAFQTYASRLLLKGVRKLQSGEAMEIDPAFLEIVPAVAALDSLEPAYRAAVLSLPGEGDLAQMQGKNVDPDAIHTARMKLMGEMGRMLRPEAPRLIAALDTPGAYSPGAEDAGKRALKNQILKLWALGGSRTAGKMIKAQFETADNMTDRFAALQAIVHYPGPEAAKRRALENFYQRYRRNHLVLDKWFTVQGTAPGPDALKNVERLMKHKDFSYSNPNRLRSLIGAFAASNPSGFNHASGDGYRIVAQVVAKLDDLNPQIAARLLTAFRSFRSLEPGRRKLAETELRQLRNKETLSADVGDILNRTLDE